MPALRFPLLIAGALALLACGSSERQSAPEAPAAPPPVASPAPAAPAPFRIDEVQLGRAIGADKRIADPTSSFAPSDTIYASVQTEGAAPSVSLTARWSYEDGQLVDETTETIAPTGPATTEFHVAKPDGWPAGKYKIEIIADGKTTAEREFEVR